MDSGYYERYMLSKDKLLPEKVQAELNPFLDSYAMSRTISPMMVSLYRLQLPNKKVLRKKLQKLANISQIEDKE